MPCLPTDPSGRLICDTPQQLRLASHPRKKARSNETSRRAFFLFLHLIRPVLLVAEFGRQLPEIAYQFNPSPLTSPTNLFHKCSSHLLGGGEMGVI